MRPARRLVVHEGATGVHVRHRVEKLGHPGVMPGRGLQRVQPLLRLLLQSQHLQHRAARV